MPVTDETLKEIHWNGMMWSNLKSVPLIFISCVCMVGRELLDEWISFSPAWVRGFILNVFQVFSVAVIKEVTHDVHKTSEMNAMKLLQVLVLLVSIF